MKKEITEDLFKKATVEAQFSQKNILSIVADSREEILKSIETKKRLEKMLEYIRHVDDNKITPADSVIFHAIGKTIMHILHDDKLILDESILEK